MICLREFLHYCLYFSVCLKLFKMQNKKKENLAQKRKKEKVPMFVPYTERLNKNLWIGA